MSLDPLPAIDKWTEHIAGEMERGGEDSGRGWSRKTLWPEEVTYCLSLTSGTLLRLAATSHLINDMMGTSDERCNLDVLELCGSRSGQRSLEWRGGFPNCRPVIIKGSLHPDTPK